MDIKIKLLKNLKNEINSSTIYDRDSVYYGTLKDAKDLFEKIKNGKFDQVFRSKNIVLSKLFKWNLAIDWTNVGGLTLKDYRLFDFEDEINERIAKLNEDDMPNDERRQAIGEIDVFLERLRSGIYDEVLSARDFWFTDSIEFEAFMAWDSALQRSQKPQAITYTNYIVFSVYHRLLSHVDRVNKWKDIFGYYYDTRYSHHTQTPTTVSELQAYENLALEIVEMNYDWRAAREVVRYFNGANVYEDYEFPHNFEQMKKIFYPPYDYVVFPQYGSEVECCHSVDAVRDRARELSEWLTFDNLVELFLNRNETPVDVYLRRMIVSQFDCGRLKYPDKSEALFKKTLEDVMNYSGPSKDKYTAVSENLIRDILENPSNYEEDDVKRLFKSNRDTLDTLYNIAYGTLYSLFAYSTETHVQIYDDSVELQKKLGCWCGTVGYNDYNSVRLPNGKVIYSIAYEDIEGCYERTQEEYDFYLENSSSDFEYIEGCVEIVGNVVISQIFREGNKRTSKCLFNALLMARGIVPPILDFNKNETKTWLEFAYNRNNMYMSVKREMLAEAVKVAEYFREFEMQGGGPKF